MNSTPSNDKSQKSLRQREIQILRRFDELTKLMGDLDNDPACLRMPHPARMLCMPATHPDIAPHTIGGLTHDQRVKDLIKEGLATNDIWNVLADEHCDALYRFLDQTSATAEVTGGYNNGSAGAIFQGLRYQVMGGTLFTIDDDLLEMLEHTDIDLEIPMSDIKLPFDNVYIELGTDRRSDSDKRTMHNATSGDHVLEGAYVSMTRRRVGEMVLEFTMTGSPVGKNGIGDDAVEWLSLEQYGNRSIGAALHNAFRQGFHIFDPEKKNDAVSLPDSVALQALETGSARRLELVVKALLYLSLPQLRTEVQKDRTDADKVAARANSTSHKRKALRQAMRTYNRILVLPPPPPAPSAATDNPSDDETRSVRSHFRRGHFRTQRFGEAYAQSRLIWIAPVLVNPSRIDDLVSKRNYLAPKI